MTGRHVSPDEALLRACRQVAGDVLARTEELAKIPAPPLDEADRIARVRQWWRDDELQVTSQPVGNLWAPLRTGAGSSRPALVIAAHLDTVFGREVPHGLSRRPDGILTGPGCGDDTVAVAALSALDRLLPAALDCPVWIVATVGEEGLGNLAGARAALADPPVPVGAFLALEGNYLGRVNTVGVGSERRRVRISTAGGHAWEAADAPSAVHAAAEIVRAIDEVPLTHPAKTSRNVGLLAGGESINSRARHAQFDLDLRSEAAAALAELTEAVDRILRADRPGVTVEVQPLGSRPAGSIDQRHPLVVAAADALQEMGIRPRFTAASTDANVAYQRDIPAVTVGITYGDGTHTEKEWIDPDAIFRGLYALTRTIVTSAHSPRVEPTP